MSDDAPNLSFDRATYAAPTSPDAPTATASGAAPCGSCKRPLTDEYWKWQRLIVCRFCRDGLAATLAQSQSASSFGKAVVQGGGAAIACGIAYAVFVAVSKIQFALATIGIAYVVATVIRKASRGVSGRRFQVLAVALTYVASTMGYAPGIFEALKGTGSHHSATSSKSDIADVRPASAPAGAPTPSAPHDDSAAASDHAKGTSDSGTEKKSVSPGQLAMAIVFLVGVTLAAPFLELTEAPLGAIIILIGLWEAWRRSRGLPTVIEGPFRVAPPQAAAAVSPAA